MAGGGRCTELSPTSRPTSYYYVSVVPRQSSPAYTIGGASFVTRRMNRATCRRRPSTSTSTRSTTAQITILVFQDNAPINNAPDLPTEDPAEPGGTDMSGFPILVEDAGGRYGASAGVQSQDAFGNPLGTTYDAARRPVRPGCIDRTARARSPAPTAG